MNVILLCYGDNTDAFEIVLFGDLFRIRLKLVSNVLNFTVDLDEGADGEHFLHGALGDELALAVLVLEYDAHAAA